MKPFLRVAFAFLALGAPPAAADYRGAVMADAPASYWRLAGLSDETGNRPLAGEGASAGAWNQPGAVADDTAVRLPGEPLSAASYALYSFDIGHPYTFPFQEPFTLEAWIRPERLNTHTRRVFSAESNRYPLEGGYLLGVRADGLVFSRYGRYPTPWWSTLQTPITAGRWQHVAATYDGTTMRLYVDGQLRDERGSTGFTPNWERLSFSIGSKDRRYKFFAGGIDEAAVYTRALPADRVRAHYAAR
jgi:hypothetical protein